MANSIRPTLKATGVRLIACNSQFCILDSTMALAYPSHRFCRIRSKPPPLRCYQFFLTVYPSALKFSAIASQAGKPLNFRQHTHHLSDQQEQLQEADHFQPWRFVQQQRLGWSFCSNRNFGWRFSCAGTVVGSLTGAGVAAGVQAASKNTTNTKDTKIE